MPTEYTIVTILLAGIGAVFALYQRGTTAALAAKDAEIAWLRSQLDAWTEIGRAAVTTAEKLTRAAE